MSEQRQTAEKDHANRVRDMFATIAKRYDLLNHLLSGNTDKKWRRLVSEKVRQRVDSNRAEILDVACGTGDLSLALFEATASKITAIDFCREMLEIGAQKALNHKEQIKFIEGDAMKLPFRDQSFEIVTIGFGLRNLSAVEQGLKELFRVLKPGGSLAVLEFSKPQTPGLNKLFHFYFTKLLPFMGGAISGSRSAYSYLPKSVQSFPDQKQLASLMDRIGFEEVGYQNLTGGIAALHLARRPK